MTNSPVGLQAQTQMLTEQITSCNGKLALYNLVLEEQKNQTLCLVVEVVRHGGQSVGKFKLFAPSEIAPFLPVVEEHCKKNVKVSIDHRRQLEAELASVTAQLRQLWDGELVSDAVL